MTIEALRPIAGGFASRWRISGWLGKILTAVLAVGFFGSGLWLIVVAARIWMERGQSPDTSRALIVGVIGVVWFGLVANASISSPTAAPDRKQRSKSFCTKVEAQRWLRSEIGKLDRDVWVDPTGGATPYRVHAERWLDGLVDIKPKTRHGYRGLLDTRVLPAFGAYELRRIDTPAIRAWISSMVDGGLSPSRIRQARQVLNASLEQAVEDGLIGRNPAKRAKVPTDHPREMRFLNPSEVRDLAIEVERHQPGAGVLVYFLSYTGLRWGEVVALRRSSLDLLRREVKNGSSYRGRRTAGIR